MRPLLLLLLPALAFKLSVERGKVISSRPGNAIY